MIFSNNRRLLLSCALLAAPIACINAANQALPQATTEQAPILEPIVATTNKKDASLDNSFKAQSYTTTIYTNKAFFVDTQYPSFTITYHDTHGNTKTRTYNGEIKLAGLNIELAVRASAIFLTNPAAFDFAESNKTIELGTGFEIFPGFLEALRDTYKLAPQEEAKVFINALADYMKQQFPTGAVNMGAIPSDFIRDDFKWDQEVQAITRLNISQEDKFKLLWKMGHAKSEATSVKMIKLRPLALRVADHIGLIYIPFTNLPGGMIIVTASVGPLGLINQHVHGTKGILDGGISLVRGGTLTPIN